MPSSDRTTPPGVPARQVALRLLDGVLRRDQTLDATVSGATTLPSPDQALARAIAGEVLRRLPDLDRLIDSATRLRLADDAKARMVLRMALAQRIGLGTPEHAVVATALPLVDGGPRRLVHAVLGTLLRRGLPTLDASHLPEAVEARWRAAWGQEAVSAARRAITQRPPLDLSFRDEASAAAFPDGESLATRHRRLRSNADVATLPGFADGGWWVQDWSSSLPARLIPSDAASVLDLCAAPGGKTMQLAAAGHAVTALDHSETRLRRLRDNLARTGLAARPIAADALTWSCDERFDAVLIDAPCSATGTFRRHPEVLYRARPAIIAERAALQAQLLDRAAHFVRPGGLLVYTTCSLEPEEGEAVVADFLRAHPDFSVSRSSAGDLPDVITPTADGFVRILPGLLEGLGGADGFFIARLVAPRG